MLCNVVRRSLCCCAHAYRVGFATAAILALANVSSAAIIVNDTWQDANRTQPPAVLTAPFTTTYSENGADQDGDVDIESAWYISNNGGSTTVTAGHLTSLPSASSYFATTFFTPPANPITLANGGDQMKVTWAFTLTGVNSSNTSQGLPLAVALTPNGSRISADASPSSTAAYAGYSMFMNMGGTLGNSSPFQLREWGTVGGPNGATGALLGTSGNWAAESPNVNGGTSGNAGFVDGQLYTLTMTFTRNQANPASLDIAATMSGGSLNGTGSESISFNDTTPNSFSFDTFAFRPAGSASSATQIDTSNFKVEFIPVPEPASALLVVCGISLIGAMRLRRKSR
jgi:hypothetical protein